MWINSVNIEQRFPEDADIILGQNLKNSFFVFLLLFKKECFVLIHFKALILFIGNIVMIFYA